MNSASQLYVVSIPVHSEFKCEQQSSNMNTARWLRCVHSEFKCEQQSSNMNTARRLHCVPESPNTNIALTAQSEQSPVAPDNFGD